MAIIEADGGIMPGPLSGSSSTSATGDGHLAVSHRDAPLTSGWRGHLVCLVGTPGAGSSLLAMCLASELAADASNRGLVTHVELSPLTGRPLGIEADTTLDSLLNSFRFVVADLAGGTDALRDDDHAGVPGTVATAEGILTGAEGILTGADAIVLVGTAEATSLTLLARAAGTLAARTGPDRILVVVNRLPRSRRRRSAAAAEAARVLAPTATFDVGDPVLLTEHRPLEQAGPGGAALPLALLGRPIASEIRMRLASPQPGSPARITR